MEAFRITRVGVTVLACSSAPRNIMAPSPSPPPAPSPAPSLSTVPADSPPVAGPSVDPCTQGPLRDALAALGDDHVLVDTRMGDLHRPHDRVVALAQHFPLLLRDGNDVMAVARTNIFPGALVALVVPGGHAEDPGWRVTGPSLAVFTCRPGEGYGFASRPFSLGTESRQQILSVRPTRLPDGSHGATAIVAAYLSNGDWHATAYLLGVSTPDLPVRLPRAATVGVLAVIGTVGERVFLEQSHEARTMVPLDATGWYPVVGRDEQVFVRAVRERMPSPDGTWTDALRVVQLGRLGRMGFTSAVGGVPNGLWFLTGPLLPPSWCNDAEIRCGSFTMDGDVITDGTFGMTWMAGAWPTTGEAPRRVTAPEARWLYVGQWEGVGPPRDPARQVPLLELRVQPLSGRSSR